MLSNGVDSYTIGTQEREESTSALSERFQMGLNYSGNGKSPDLRSTEHGSSYSKTEQGGELQLYVVSSDMTNAQVTYGQEQENQYLMVLLH